MQVAVLGTGIMGAGMARSMLRAGLAVTVWNRSADKAAPLAEDGATVARTARAAVTGADLIVTMLFDAESVLEVIGEVSDAFGPDTVWVQSSTIGVDGAQRAAELAADRGLHLVDAPVLGTRQPAERGQLVVLAAGDPNLRERVAPVFDAVGSRTVWAGDTIGAASALKLAVNAWVAMVNTGVAQSLSLAAAVGLDPSLFLDAISGGPLDLPYAHAKGAQMLSDDFTPSFALDGVIKDLGLIRTAARDAGVAVGVLSALLSAYQQASAAGHGDEDMAAVITAFRPATG